MKEIVFVGGMKNGQVMRAHGRVASNGVTVYPNHHRCSDLLLEYRYDFDKEDEHGRLVFKLSSCTRREDRWVTK